MRIVSLFPAATELICELGLGGQLVGVSHECDWPAEVRELPKVTRSLLADGAASRQIDAAVRKAAASGNLYQLNGNLAAELRPDLIVTQSLCGVCAVSEDDVRRVAAEMSSRPRVLSPSPTCFDDLFDSLRQIGVAANCEQRAKEVIAALQARVMSVVQRNVKVTETERPRVVVLEWIDPPFSSGHWTPEIVELAGGREVIGVAGERSRTVAWQEIVDVAPEVLVIACCGFDVARTKEDLPILRNYPGWNELPCVKACQVYVFDGSAYFNRPGPRLVDALEMLAHLMHPKLHPCDGDRLAACRVERVCV